MSPQIHWVVANSTNAGKTTISSAWVSVLAERSFNPVGFKPYSGGKFVDTMDLMHDWRHKTTARLFGADGAQLIKATPCLTPQDIALVQPIVLVYFPDFDQPILARVGSLQTGDVRYIQTPFSMGLQARPDYVKMLESLGLADASLKFEVRDLRFAQTPALGHASVEACFQHLVRTYQPTHVVCEGASSFLPFWSAQHVVHHVVYLQRNELFYYANANLVLPFNPSSPLVPVSQVLNLLRGRPCKRLPLPLALSAQRTEVAKDTIRHMLGPQSN
jgi:hypothetical protein